MPLNARQQARLLQRATERLPQDLLRYIVSFVPSRVQAIFSSGKATVLWTFATSPQTTPVNTEGFYGFTYCTLKAAKLDWKRNGGNGIRLFKDCCLALFYDYWYTVKCAVYVLGADKPERWCGHVVCGEQTLDPYGYGFQHILYWPKTRKIRLAYELSITRVKNTYITQPKSFQARTISW